MFDSKARCDFYKKKKLRKNEKKKRICCGSMGVGLLGFIPYKLHFIILFEINSKPFFLICYFILQKFPRKSYIFLYFCAIHHNILKGEK